MKKKSITLCFLAVSLVAYSQVGINTPNPQGVFHVDGAKDNPATGVPNTAQQLNDVTITSAGNIGIGTLTPLARLHVQGNAIITNVPVVTSAENTSYMIVTPSGEIKKETLTNILSNPVIAAGATSSPLTLPVQFAASYEVSLTLSNGCGYSTISKFLLTGSTFNNTWSLQHITSVVGNNGPASYTVVQNSKANITMTTTTTGCADGGNSTQFNYLIDVNSSGQLTIKNNGNISRTYKLKLTQLS